MQPSSAPAVLDRPGPIRGRRSVLLVATLILTVVAFQLNSSMITPALPDIAKQLGAPMDAVSQVSSLFFLAGAVGGIVLARWSDFIGRKRALLIVLALIVLGTVLCLVSPNLPVLLLGRVLQGASSAAFQISYVILAETLPAAVFPTVLGVLTAINGGVGGVDGWIGGLLADAYGFRSLFAVILAVALVAIVCVALAVPRDGEPSSTGRMDWWGAAALSVGLICLTYFVSTGSGQGWLAPLTLLFLGGAIVSFLTFVAIEKRRRTPLVAVHHLRSRQVWPVLAVTVLTLSSVFAVINFTIVILSQNQTVGYGVNASTSALLYLTPPALIGLAAAPLSGWLAGRFGWIRMLQIGLALSIAALVVVALFPFSQWTVFAMFAVLGVAYNGLALTTTNGLGVLQSPSGAPAILPSMNSTAFGFGASLGIAIVAPFVMSGDFALALWISVGISVLALIASLFLLPKTD